MRNIQDVLHFRSDISPFLVHLTRTIRNVRTAKEALEQIIEHKRLESGDEPISAAQYGTWTSRMNQEDIKRFFSAICFTETPLNEIHCLLEITNRQVNLSPYGLVFIKDKLRAKGVNPVLYINNETEDKDDIFRALCTLMESDPVSAEKLLPLFSVFGNGILAPWARNPRRNNVDFLWEREWRYPSCYGPLTFNSEDIFIGICPHEEINHFEERFPEIKFIDPRRNIKWYASKLVETRNRLNIKFSVV